MPEARQVPSPDKTDTYKVSLEKLASKISSQRSDNGRIIVALAGPPGSGKSTITDVLQAALEKELGLTTQIVPMDGFHYDNAILKELALSHIKGAPETFDVGGLADTLKRLSNGYLIEDVAVPVFDRDIDLSRGSARLIRRETAVLLVEGNYLLMSDKPWSDLAQYFDTTIMIACDEVELEARLMKRWLDLGFSQLDAHRKVEGNDLPNAKHIIEQSKQADYTLIND